MKQTSKYIAQLLAYAKDKLFLAYEDEVCTRNALMELMQTDEICESCVEYLPLQEILTQLVTSAIKRKIITKNRSLLFETKIMGLVTLSPSVFIAKFDRIAYDNNIEMATDMWFKMSKDNNYIRLDDINKNIMWETSGDFGNIKITINLSKPEKDPKDILKAQLLNSNNSYPSCILCRENEGFAGHLGHPARQTLRLLPIELNDERWFVQYSPYMYFDQHCIALSEEHRPMKITLDTYKRLLDFVEIFPHYFIGSNAALPIVGGSILSHDHYQGGNKNVSPMLSRNIAIRYSFPKLQTVTVGILDWYNSVIRLSSRNRNELEQAIDIISTKWNNYSNENVGILSKTNEQHNAITPIIHITDDLYNVDLVLRNNRTDKTHPFGIYHPEERVHNIKKEGIGIIEVMGLFILPGRLSKEMNIIADYLTDKTKYNFTELANPNHPMNIHFDMIVQLANDLKDDKARSIVTQTITEHINKTCREILLTTGVFKHNKTGEQAFNHFLTSCGAIILD